MTSNYNQLILFDCDGGRASLFKDITMLDQLPSNCECYLFWNKDSATVTVNLNKLSHMSQIHLCPSHLKNSKNSADGKLIYFLGKLVERFDFIFIVHGSDNIYKEVVQAVTHEYGDEKIDQQEIRSPTKQALNDLFFRLQLRNELHNYVDPKPSITLSKNALIGELVDITAISCLKCSKRFKHNSSLFDHVKSKHKQDALIVCTCSRKFAAFKGFHRHRKEIQQQIIDTQGVIRCCGMQELPKVYIRPDSMPIVLLTGKMNQCSFKCSRRSFEPPGLFTHLKAKHSSDINIRIQCCNAAIQYTLDEFRLHVASQHNIIGIQ